MSTDGLNRACETIEIVNTRGLHARASAKFVNIVAALPDTVKVRVRRDGVEAEGGSILGLMMLGAAKGDSIEIECTGDDAEGALAQLAGLVRGGFGED